MRRCVQRAGNIISAFTPLHRRNLSPREDVHVRDTRLNFSSRSSYANPRRWVDDAVVGARRSYFTLIRRRSKPHKFSRTNGRIRGTGSGGSTRNGEKWNDERRWNANSLRSRVCRPVTFPRLSFRKFKFRAVRHSLAWSIVHSQV